MKHHAKYKPKINSCKTSLAWTHALQGKAVWWVQRVGSKSPWARLHLANPQHASFSPSVPGAADSARWAGTTEVIAETKSLNQNLTMEETGISKNKIKTLIITSI